MRNFTQRFLNIGQLTQRQYHYPRTCAKQVWSIKCLYFVQFITDQAEFRLSSVKRR